MMQAFLVYNFSIHISKMDKINVDPSTLEAHPGEEGMGSSTEYHDLTRKLESRHIQFIAIGGAIGTGLFLGIGRALTQAGPLSLLLGYTLSGIAIYCMMQCLGEMTTWLPLPGALPQFATRWVDPALGFALGWNSWYYCVITLCAEIAAVAVVIGYWPGAEGINIAAWISLSIVVVTALNLFAVSVYGEAEFIFASIKILTIVGLILLALIIDLGGSSQGRLGFRYWKNPGAMKEYVAEGDLGRFLGFFSTLVNAAFSYGGIETVAVAGGEAKNPRRNIPKAVRRVFWRIAFFYVLGALAIGVTVPYNDPNLLSAQKSGAKGAAASPWVIAISRANIKVLPSIINAVILSSAASSANAMTFNGSRYLYALASSGQAPKIFLKCSKGGVPWVGVLTVASISLLSFLSCSSGGSVAFTWFQNLATLSSLFTWIGICIIYVRFYKALQVQGIDRDTLVFKAPFQPYLAYFSLFFFSTIVIFNGFYAFAPWSTNNFITSYITLPIVIGLYLFWKVYKKTKWVSSKDADLLRDKAEIDSVVWEDPVPKNWIEKFWYWLA
ncbi:AAT family amino acid transporter [Dactylonectria macrodidyma]|uniref:AAT family amino acid transporter n=1 Tax=Dactylonectria macrodidyma TaxID=307937 RepID=A0A9P9ER48_9HYPO|nr:AAT family amino acid transporter [Dactylonectria macrodidyma]